VAAWAETLQHRFGGAGTLAGHPVGNLLLTGLVEVTGGPVHALDMVGRLLGAAGRVLPLSVEPLDIVAEVVGADPQDPSAVREVRGQVAVATTPGQVVGVRLDPASVAACPEALDAVRDADWVVFGPGSWFTSVIPHLLVADMGKALSATKARRLVTLNLSPQPGETEGFSPETHLEVLAAHAPDLQVDVVLAARRAVLRGDGSLRAAAESLGATLRVSRLGEDGGAPVHDPNRLAAAYSAVFSGMEGTTAWR
jgi:uncharacterized cofD-like protein